MKRILTSICVSVIIYYCNSYLRRDETPAEVASTITVSPLKAALAPGTPEIDDAAQPTDSSRNYHKKIESLFTNIGDLMEDK